MDNNGWVSVQESLPPPDPAIKSTQPEWTESDLVWAWGDRDSFGDSMFLASFDHSDGRWYDGVDLPVLGNDVRFWRLKPDPPKGCDWNLYPSQVERRESGA